MPKVSDYDNEKDWMSACVPKMMDDKGMKNEQAVAACLNMWRERDMQVQENELAMSAEDMKSKIDSMGSEQCRALLKKMGMDPEGMSLEEMKSKLKSMAAQDPEKMSGMMGMRQMSLMDQVQKIFRFLGISQLLQEFEEKKDERWVTINGQHILIDDKGEVKQGNKKAVGWKDPHEEFKFVQRRLAAGNLKRGERKMLERRSERLAKQVLGVKD